MNINSEMRYTEPAVPLSNTRQIQGKHKTIMQGHVQGFSAMAQSPKRRVPCTALQIMTVHHLNSTRQNPTGTRIMPADAL